MLGTLFSGFLLLIACLACRSASSKGKEINDMIGLQLVLIFCTFCLCLALTSCAPPKPIYTPTDVCKRTITADECKSLVAGRVRVEEQRANTERRVGK